jgi:hypothetical protein
VKVAIVPVRLLTEDLDLRAVTYAHPTMYVDREIRRAKSTIVNAHKRYKVLVAERDRIREGNPNTLQLDVHGRLRRQDWENE